MSKLEDQLNGRDARGLSGVCPSATEWMWSRDPLENQCPLVRRRWSETGDGRHKTSISDTTLRVKGFTRGSRRVPLRNLHCSSKGQTDLPLWSSGSERFVYTKEKPFTDRDRRGTDLSQPTYYLELIRTHTPCPPGLRPRPRSGGSSYTKTFTFTRYYWVFPQRRSIT